MAKKRRKRGGQSQALLAFGVLMAVIFLPSTLLLAVGMLPTLVVMLTDRSRTKIKAVTVGALNLSGCTPFLLALWANGHTLTESIEIISDSTTIVIIYTLAVFGYLVDWVVTSTVAGVLYQKGQIRQKEIKARQAELVKRWGEEVTGALQLDEEGFPMKQGQKKKKLEEDDEDENDDY